MIIDEKLEVIEPIMNFQKIKYSKLNELIPIDFIQNKRVNFYINLNSILDNFYTDNIISAMNSLQGSEYLVFVPEFLNILAHYRHYMFSRFQCRTRFFIYYLNKPVKTAKHINKNYCKKYLDRLDINERRTGVTNNVLKTIFNMIDKIIYYLPNCYFIESNGLELSLIPYYIIDCLNKKKNQCNIVLTHDYYDFQLLNHKDTMILSPAGSRSKSYFKKDIYYKKTKNTKYQLENELSPELFSVMNAYCGIKERNIEKIGGFSKIAKSLDNGIINGLINNSYNPNIKLISSLFKEDIEDELNKNFLLTDLKTQYNIMSNLNKEMIKNKLINLNDNYAIMDLNSNYFQYNNIQLIEIEEGE